MLFNTHLNQENAGGHFLPTPEVRSSNPVKCNEKTEIKKRVRGWPIQKTSQVSFTVFVPEWCVCVDVSVRERETIIIFFCKK